MFLFCLVDLFDQQVVVESHYKGNRDVNGNLTYMIPQNFEMRYYRTENGVGKLFPARGPDIIDPKELILFSP